VTTPLETKLKALVQDWRDEADFRAREGDDRSADAYYECSNQLEDLLGERPPLNLVPRPPDRQRRSAISTYKPVEDTPPL
jgi:hypothetical protein